MLVEFLKRLLRGAEKPITLLVDGRPAHKAKIVKAFAEQQQGRLQLVLPPPYAPDEPVWGYIEPRLAEPMPENKIEF